MTPSRPEIRAFAREHLESVLTIAANSPETPQWPLRAYEDLLQPPAETAFRRFAKVASIDGTVRGFAVACLLLAAGEAELETIVVDPLFRRRGLGAQLLDSLEPTLRRWGARTLHLEVRASNDPAIAFYQARGFRPCGRRRGYYRDPLEDAFLFERLLGQ